jgi:hypothetical protein
VTLHDLHSKQSSLIIGIIARYDLFDLKASLHKNFNPVSLPDAFCSLHYVHDIRMFDCNIEAGLGGRIRLEDLLSLSKEIQDINK